MKTWALFGRDMLCGLAVSVLAVQLSAVTFGAAGSNIYFAAIAAVMFLAAAVYLLRTERKAGRTVRGLTAFCGYLSMLALDNKSGMNSLGRIFALMNPEYVKEYGGPSLDHAVMMVFLIMPGAFMMILLAVFIAGRVSKPKRISETEGIRPAGQQRR